MTLRSRLIAAFVLVALAITSAAFSILYFQQRYIDNQIDRRLERLSSVAEVIVAQSETRTSESQLLLNALWEGYVGVFESNGSLQKVNTPESDPELQPDVNLYSASVDPQTQFTTSGKAKKIRTMTVALSDGRVALVGLATTEGDEVISQLKTTLVSAGLVIYCLLGLTSWWLYRLGLRPIRLMTREAEAIADGTRRAAIITRPRTSIETAKLEQSMNRAISTTQQSELRMRRLLADASHELRTPLTSLQGYSSLYLTGVLRSDEQVSDAMNRIHDESLRMSRLVNELLELSSLEERTVSLKKNFSLLPLLEKLKQDVRASHPLRIVGVNCQSSIEINGDDSLVFQAILNLVSNAIRHTSDEAEIRISAFSTLNCTRIEVADNGQGIAPEYLAHLFDRFYRVDESRGTQTGGSGLGLAIVSEIMRFHKGGCGVESTEGEGSIFWLEFPDL